MVNKDTKRAYDAKRYAANRTDVILRASAWNRHHSALARKASAKWAKANPHRTASYAAARKARKLRATPSWADSSKIQGIYATARRLTNETGVPYEVDHIVPLVSSVVCGLHVENNLRVVRRTTNRMKSNHFHI